MADSSSASRARSTVLGLVTGDSVAWPSLWQRLSLLPERRTTNLASLWEFAIRHRTTDVAVPYLHATPRDVVNFTGPTDDSEWFLVGLRASLNQTLTGRPAGSAHQVWTELAALPSDGPEALRCRIGTTLALKNLRNGLAPPETGRFNAHYFDDIGCVRALAPALLEIGHPAAAAERAQIDTEVTHAYDGLWCARATAALFSALLAGSAASVAVDAALAELPEESWSRYLVMAIIEAANHSDSQLDLSATTEHKLLDQIYGYSVSAPETVGLLMAHLLLSRGPDDLLAAASSHPRHADSLLPLAGAAAGCVYGDAWIPREKREHPIILQGTSISPLAGVSLSEATSAVIDR